MTTENDIKQITFSIEDYLDDNYEFFSTVDRWHAKVIDVVRNDLALESAELAELTPLIIQIASMHDKDRVGGQDYDLAATEDDIKAAALRVARNVSGVSYNDFHFLVWMEVNDSGLLVRGADKHMIEDAAVEYHYLTEEEA